MIPYRDVYKYPRLKDHLKNRYMIEFIKTAIDDFYNNMHIGKVDHWNSYYDNGWIIKYHGKPCHKLEEFIELIVFFISLLLISITLLSSLVLSLLFIEP